MKKFLLMMGLVLSLSAVPYSAIYADDGLVPQKTVVIFEDGTFKIFDKVLTDKEIIAVYETWYKEHPQFGTL